MNRKVTPRLKIGLKLFTLNTALIRAAVALHAEGWFDYIELGIVPGSFTQTRREWKALSIPFIIHAPHSGYGVNLADRTQRSSNLLKLSEAQRFADLLAVDTIILHGGNNGDLNETIKQIRSLDDKRFVLENKPKMGLQNEICVGFAPDDFKRVLAAGVVSRTVLDFGHATYAACSLKMDALELIRRFQEFYPCVYHLSDGDTASEKDMHLNLGKGDFNLPQYVDLMPAGARVTLETPRNADTGLDDFEKDVLYLRELAVTT